MGIGSDGQNCLHCKKLTGHKTGICLSCRKELKISIRSGTPENRKRNTYSPRRKQV